MLDPITLALATPIAKIIFDKFYEGTGSKLGEKAVELAAAPIQKLGQLIWGRCLQRADDATQAAKLLQSAADGSTEAQKKLEIGVNQVLDADPALRTEAETIAKEINQQIQIGEMSGGEVWNVFGGKAEKNEFTDNKAPIIKDSTGPITINYGVPPA
jgi:hypothetical protein